MLHAAITRLEDLWPDALIQVLTDAPELLPQCGANTVPLGAAGRHAVLRNRRDSPDAVAFHDVVANADLVLVAGMGGIADAFRDYASGVLETLRLAIQSGACTAIVSQGLGPLRDSNLARLAAEVLQRVDLIALREGRAGLPLLDSLGVGSDRVVVTGDDAIETAYELRSDVPGECLGVNLRASDYAAVDGPLVERVRDALQPSARRIGAAMLSVPISNVPGEADVDTAVRLFLGYGRAEEPTTIESYLGVIAQIRRCRAIVTGSYHAGVFALSLGIPAVCLASSDYYVDKFLGLADQFGAGCEVVSLVDGRLPESLGRALDYAWHSAEELRPQLLARSARQIALGHAAYDRLRDIVAARRPHADAQ